MKIRKENKLNKIHYFQLRYFNSFDAKAILGYRLLNNFSNCIFFYSCNYSSFSDYKSYLESFDHLYLKASSSSSTLIVITDTSTTPPRNMQATSTMHLWKLRQQVSCYNCYNPYLIFYKCLSYVGHVLRFVLYLTYN